MKDMDITINVENIVAPIDIQEGDTIVIANGFITQIIREGVIVYGEGSFKAIHLQELI
jgi:hypothetical protein